MKRHAKRFASGGWSAIGVHQGQRLCALGLIAALFLAWTPAAPAFHPNGLRFRAVRAEVSIPLEIGRPLFHSASIALSTDESELLVGGAGRVELAVVSAHDLTLLREIYTADAVDSFKVVDDGRYVVANANFGRVRGKFFLTFISADEVFILDSKTLNLRHRVRVGQNIGNLADLGDGTILVPAVQGRRITRVELSSGRVMAQLNTRREVQRFHPTHAVSRRDNAIALVTEGAFRLGGRGSWAIGSRVLVLDPLAPTERSRFMLIRGLKHPRGVVFARDGRHVFVVDRLSDSIALVDLIEGRIVVERPVAKWPDQIVHHTDDVFFILHNKPFLTRVAKRDGAVSTLDLPSVASKATPAPNGRYLYLALAEGVGIVDLASFDLVDVIETSRLVANLTVTRDGRRLYAVLSKGSGIALIE